MSQTFSILQIIQLIYSNSSADLYPYHTVFELSVTLVMFLREAVYQKLLVDCLLKLSQMCSEQKSKSSIMILSYKFAEINFTLFIKTDLQIEDCLTFPHKFFLKYIFRSGFASREDRWSLHWR